MLVIRKDQMETLGRYMAKRFEDRMVVHLTSRFKEQLAEVTEPGLRGLIRTGVEQAKQSAITKERDIRRYLEYMVQYGTEFARNDQTAWAARILNTAGLSGTQKMDRIDNYHMFSSMEQP